jgi:HSP20 family protein
MTGWDLFREMDDMFRGFGFGRLLEPSFATPLGARNYPRVNVREDNENLYVEALIPGVDPKGLEMSVLGNTLTVSGERKEQNLGKVTWHRRERGTGRFLRAVDLPAEIDIDRVKAEFRDGVLNVTLPKAASAKPRQITIKAA